MARHRADLVIAGGGPAVRYALRRSIPGLPAAFPVYELDEVGAATRLATLHPVEPAGFLVESDTPLAGFAPGFPWFLDDLRPAGFLGRLVPALHPDLGLPRDILAWTVEHACAWLHDHGADLVGNVVLGEPALMRALDGPPPDPVPAADRGARYPGLAREVLAHGVAGSSAGGEQPKFLAVRLDITARVPVLVKFTPPVADAPSRRAADLLWCEHLALEAVRDAGIPAARSAVLIGGGRTFLEVERFDRTTAGGRRGLVSLRVLDAAFVGAGADWSTVARGLYDSGHIDLAARDAAVWLDRFGAWIGNTDRHLGNLSVTLARGRLGGLAPAYDLLPMAYAPRGGEVLDVDLALPTLRPDRRDLWEGSWRAAFDFWRRVSAHPQISPGFRAIAAQNGELLEAAAPRIARLPA